MSNATMHCDVCGAQGIAGVASSTLGPMSMAYCRNCLQNSAEPYGLTVMMVFEAIAGPVPFTAEVATNEWLLDGMTVWLDGAYVPVREALCLPSVDDIARYIDDGGPVDLAGWAHRVMRETSDRVDESNRQHCAGVPHADCSCSCSCCYGVCAPIRSKPAQEQADGI